MYCAWCSQIVYLAIDQLHSFSFRQSLYIVNSVDSFFFCRIYQSYLLLLTAQHLRLRPLPTAYP